MSQIVLWFLHFTEQAWKLTTQRILKATVRADHLSPGLIYSDIVACPVTLQGTFASVASDDGGQVAAEPFVHLGAAFPIATIPRL